MSDFARNEIVNVGDGESTDSDAFFVGEQIVCDVRGLDFGEIEVRTDVFSDVASDSVAAIRRLVKRWRAHRRRVDDDEDPTPTFVAVADDRDHEWRDDDANKDDETPDDAKRGGSEADETAEAHAAEGVDEQRAEIRVDLVWRDGTCVDHGRETTCTSCGGWRHHDTDCAAGYDEGDPCYCERCGLAAGCPHCTYGGPLYYLLRFSSAPVRASGDDDSVALLPRSFFWSSSSSSSSSSRLSSTGAPASSVVKDGDTIVGYGLLVAESGCASYRGYESDDAKLHLASSASSALGNLPRAIRSEIAQTGARRRAAVHQALSSAFAPSKDAVAAETATVSDDGRTSASEPVFPPRLIDTDILSFLTS